MQLVLKLAQLEKQQEPELEMQLVLKKAQLVLLLEMQ